SLLGLYALACLAKEHGIMIPGLLVAAELTVIQDARPWRARLAALRPLYLALFAVAAAFVGVHSLVLGGNGVGGFQPFVPFQALQLGNRDRILTMFGVVPHWLRLFYWPAHLSSEHAPP